MNIIFGRAYNDGIDFVVRDNCEKFCISAKKTASTNIITREVSTYVRDQENKILRFFFVLILATFLYFIASYSKYIPMNKYMIICISSWLFLTSYYWINNKFKVNQQKFKYHAVEHKILNYYEKNNKVPTNVMDVVDEKPTLLFCGTMIVTLLLIFTSIVLVTITLNVNFFLKLLIILVGGLLTLVFWVNDKLYFFQNLTIAEPSREDLELGIEAMKFLVKLEEDMER